MNEKKKLVKFSLLLILLHLLGVIFIAGLLLNGYSPGDFSYPLQRSSESAFSLRVLETLYYFGFLGLLPLLGSTLSLTLEHTKKRPGKKLVSRLLPALIFSLLNLLVIYRFYETRLYNFDMTVENFIIGYLILFLPYHLIITVIALRLSRRAPQDPEASPA